MDRFASSEVFAAASSLGDALDLPDEGMCSGVVVAAVRDRIDTVVSFAGIQLPADGVRFVAGSEGHLGVRLSPELSDVDAETLVAAISDGYTVDVLDGRTLDITL